MSLFYPKGQVPDPFPKGSEKSLIVYGKWDWYPTQGTYRTHHFSPSFPTQHYTSNSGTQGRVGLDDVWFWLGRHPSQLYHIIPYMTLGTKCTLPQPCHTIHHPILSYLTTLHTYPTMSFSILPCLTPPYLTVATLPHSTICYLHNFWSVWEILQQGTCIFCCYFQWGSNPFTKPNSYTFLCPVASACWGHRVFGFSVCEYIRPSKDQVKILGQGRISRSINGSKLIFHMRIYLNETSRNMHFRLWSIFHG